mgnify:CR=1 FL=1
MPEGVFVIFELQDQMISYRFIFKVNYSTNASANKLDLSLINKDLIP